MNPAWVSQLLNRSQTKVSIQDYDCFSCFFIFGEGITPRGSLPNSPITSRPAAGAPPAALGLGAAFFCFFSEASEASDWRPLEKASGSSGQPDFGWEGTEGTSYLFGPSPYRSDSYVKISKSHDISYIIIHYHTLSYYQCYQFKNQNLKRSQPHCTTPQRMSWSSSFSSFPSLEVQRNTSIDLRPKGPLQHPSAKRQTKPWPFTKIMGASMGHSQHKFATGNTNSTCCQYEISSKLSLPPKKNKFLMVDGWVSQLPQRPFSPVPGAIPGLPPPQPSWVKFRSYVSSCSRRVCSWHGWRFTMDLPQRFRL